MNAEQISSRLDGRKASGGWQAKCPAHEDKHASLSISEGNDGRVLAYCHAGCTLADIATGAGIPLSEFFADEPMQQRRSQIVAEYDYTDEHGEVLYQVVRMDPKDFRQRKPDGSGWNWSTKGVRRVLYRLPELKKLKPGQVVFVVEGEKDVQSLVSLGLQATTNAGGADKWAPEFGRALEGFRVAILPDNDPAGVKHAKTVTGTLGDTKHVVIDLPGLPGKGDVSDWIANGGDKEKLVALVRAAFVEKDSQGFASAASRFNGANELRKENIKRVMPYNVSYLDDELLGIHPNDIIVIMAATGAGKTTLGCLLAAQAARDGRKVAFFALEAYQNEIELRELYRAVVTLAKEQGEFRPWMTQQRWIKEGIPELEKFVEPCIHHLEKKLKTLSTFYRHAKFDKEDVKREFLAQEGEAELIILDHIHHIDSDGSNENSELKSIIKIIRDCGQKLGIPVIVIAHVRKMQSGAGGKQSMPTTDDLHGSSDVAKMATAIISVAPARDEEFRSDDLAIANTFMAVVKDRIGGDKGYAALMQFDLARMNYLREYRLCRRMPNGSAELAEKRPGWAKSARRV